MDTQKLAEIDQNLGDNNNKVHPYLVEIEDSISDILSKLEFLKNEFRDLSVDKHGMSYSDNARNALLTAAQYLNKINFSKG